MTEEQLEVSLDKLNDDKALQEKLKGAENANAVAAIAKEAGFDITDVVLMSRMYAWWRYQTCQTNLRLKCICAGDCFSEYGRFACNLFYCPFLPTDDSDRRHYKKVKKQILGI